MFLIVRGKQKAEKNCPSSSALKANGNITNEPRMKLLLVGFYNGDQLGCPLTSTEADLRH